MAQAPIMPLFTDALIGDTMHLTTEEFGAYLLILIATWRNNGSALRDDDVKMSRIARCGLNRWQTKIKPRLIEFFDISDGWHQKRLEKEWSIVSENKKKQAIKGKLSVQARRLKKLNIERTEVQAQVKPPYPLKKEEDSDSAGAESAAACATAITPDPIKAMFDRGIALLGEAGVAEKQARSITGKWRSDHGITAVMAAFTAAEDEPAISDPVGFIVRVLNNNSKRARTNGSGHHKPSPADNLFAGFYEAAVEQDARDGIDQSIAEPLLDRRRSPGGAQGSG